MSRFYEPVKVGLALSYSDEDVDFDWSDLAIYGVRSRENKSRILATDLRLCESKADRLCDILEEVRRTALSGGAA